MMKSLKKGLASKKTLIDKHLKNSSNDKSSKDKTGKGHENKPQKSIGAKTLSKFNTKSQKRGRPALAKNADQYLTTSKKARQKSIQQAPINSPLNILVQTINDIVQEARPFLKVLLQQLTDKKTGPINNTKANNDLPDHKDNDDKEPLTGPLENQPLVRAQYGEVSSNKENKDINVAKNMDEEVTINPS